MDKNTDQLSFRDFPTALVIAGFLSIAGSIYFYLQSHEWIPSAIALGFSLLLFLFATVLDVSADRLTRTLNISRRGLVYRYQREIPFNEIASIQVGSRYDSDDGSRTYRVELLLNDTSVVPLRNAYSSGRRCKEKQAEKLRAFIGVGGTDLSISGSFRNASRQMQPQFQAEQESITGNQNEVHETNGVRWQIKTFAMSTTPITRWHSSDYLLPDHFLYLTQKMTGQKNPPDNKLVQAMYEKLFEQSLKIYGFDAADTPNLQNADLFTLDARLDETFFAFTSNASLARQILNPWTAIPLAAWAQAHPFKQNSTDQLAVLFAPGGLYLAVMGYVNAEYLAELAALGAELVRAQGN